MKESTPDIPKLSEDKKKEMILEFLDRLEGAFDSWDDKLKTSIGTQSKDLRYVMLNSIIKGIDEKSREIKDIREIIPW